jgi:enamine deaminase RidA (YjgF/YER057c/UK114 family)
MSPTVLRRLQEAGLELPAAPPAAGAYVQTTQIGDLLYTSGQVAVLDGGLIATGKVGLEVDLEQATRCAEQCALNVLAQLQNALGDLDAIQRVVKLTVFVASAPGFTQQHLVANGASDLFVRVLGDVGTHCRSAIGVASLPLDSPVEVEAVVQVAG